MKFIQKHRILLLIFLGFLFRLFLAFGAYDTIVFDSKGYSDFAIDFLSGKWPIDCCAKNVGYGAFLAVVYKLFGVENFAAVRLVHIFVDLVSALLLYEVAKKIFNQKAAFFSFVIYLFNPFGAAFTGLVLAETVSIFLVVLLTFILSRPGFRTNWILWFAFGVTAGLLLFTRHSFYYFLFVFFAVLAIWVVGEISPTSPRLRGVKGIQFLTITISAFLVASSYSLLVYYKTFGKIAVVPPYNLKYEIIYLNYYRWKYPEVVFTGEHPAYQEVVQGYWNTPIEEKAAHSKKYQKLLMERFPKEWPTFLSNIGWNILWLWEKDHIYTYVDQFYPEDALPMRLLNIGLIGLWAIGVMSEIREKGKKVFREPVFLFSILLFFYITFLFSLLSNESRHTLVYYPILSLWAGKGLGILSAGPASRFPPTRVTRGEARKPL